MSIIQFLATSFLGILTGSFLFGLVGEFLLAAFYIVSNGALVGVTEIVALAAALRADQCEIYTDVDGVYTADPRIVKKAKKLDEITYDGTSDTFEGISYQVPDFMTPVGNDIDKVCYDTPSTNRIGTITFTYGELTYELEIDISR